MQNDWETEDDDDDLVPGVEEIEHRDAHFLDALDRAWRALDEIAHDDNAAAALQDRVRSLIADHFEVWGVAHERVTDDMVEGLLENVQVVLQRDRSR